MNDLFHRRGLSLDRLASFLRVAEAGGFARAAPKQPVLQSQMSRQIRELEEFFGRRVFERRGRTLALTPTGKQLALLVRDTFRGLADVARDASPLPYAIGAGDSLLHWWIIPRLGAALAEVPPATVRLYALSSPEIGERLL